MARLIIDDSDPCGTAARLREAYAKLVSGTAAQIVSFRAGDNGVERSTTFHKANPAALLTLLRSYEQQCAVKQGGKPRRRALYAGGNYGR